MIFDMSCYYPMIGLPKDDGTYKIISTRDKDFFDYSRKEHPDSILIPCGHCIGCRLDYSRSWADRMMLELETAGKGVFVTLTYDNEHVPVSEFDLGGNPVFYTLNKRDVQLFMKRLRKEYSGLRIRFYLAGEYGEKTLRPHYHCILFGLGLSDIRDLIPHGRNELGQQYYISADLAKTWSCGFVLVSDVSWKTCAYVARYVTKKVTGDRSIEYAYRNALPEFALMSRKPGLGREYFDLHPDCLDFENINLTTPEGGLKLRIPKYYLKQLRLTDEERYDKMMHDRKIFAEDAMVLKLQKTGLSYVDYLEQEEDRKLDSVKRLYRKKVD